MAKKQRGVMVIAATVTVVVWTLVGVSVADTQGGNDGQNSQTVSEGSLSIEFDGRALERLGWELVARGSKEGEVVGRRVIFPVLPSSTLRLETMKDAGHRAIAGAIQTRGALLLTGVGDRVVVGNMTVVSDADGVWTVSNTLGDSLETQEVFVLSAVTTAYSVTDRHVRLVGELSPAKSWVTALGIPEAAGVTIGVVSIEANLGAVGDSTVISAPGESDVDGEQEGQAASRIGPDVVVGDLYGMMRFGRVGTITAYAIGTTSCNYGDQTAIWISYTNQHPIILQALHRLKEGRFEQIGMSWLKHGFYAVSGNACNLGCTPTDGTELGIGCSDPYSAYLNGVQGNMSLRSDVNAHTGYFPYPWTAPGVDPTIGKRIQVHDADLDPDLNAGAQYFVEGHYITPDEPAWGNDDNNASYRPVNVTETTPGSNNFSVNTTGSTQRGEAAIRAWQDYDSGVYEMDMPVPNEGLFILGMKVTGLGGGAWHYDFAVQNLNSDRSARLFTMELPDDAVLANIGFHDVDYHSGEIYDLTDWTHSVGPNAVTWSTDSYDVDPDANALRYGTLYNFRFDANFSPEPLNVTIGLFKPGDPIEVTALLDIGCASTPLVNDAITPNQGFGTKNRYMSFGIAPHASGKRHAIQVTLVSLPGYEYAEGRTMWVQEPREVTETSGSAGTVPLPTSWMADLGCDPYWTDWSTHDIVHVYDDAIVPSATYEIRSIAEMCNLVDLGSFSAALPVVTSGAGDIVGDCGERPCSPANGVVDFLDISGVADKFRNLPLAPIKARADVTNADIADPIPDQKVDFVDISDIVEAFRGAAVLPPGPPLVDLCGS